MIFNIDFDGTVCTHDFPKIGKSIGAERVLKRLTDNGHKLILFTMRSDKECKNISTSPEILAVQGQFLTEAVEWFKQNNIPLWGVQTNPDQKLWTSSPKSYAEVMIDDSALGCPLRFDALLSKRPFVCWETVEQMLEQTGCFQNETIKQ